MRRQPPKEKLCTKCGQTKPSSEFYYTIGPSDRFSCYCKKCMRAYYKPRRPVNLERATDRQLAEELRRRGYEVKKHTKTTDNEQ